MANFFNSIRIILEFYVWQQQHDGFMERFDRYLATAWKHGISCMVTLGNDCMQPKEYTKPFHLGTQVFLADVGCGGNGFEATGQHFTQYAVLGQLLDHLLAGHALARDGNGFVQ